LADPSDIRLGSDVDNRVPPELGGNGKNRISPNPNLTIDVEVEDRMFRTLKRRIFPIEIEGILWQAQTGDLYWQEQLWSVMVDTWYRLATNLKKLRMEVQGFEYEIAPWSAKNKKPTPRAVEKADFVEQALFGMKSNSAWSELDFTETLGALVDSLLSGFMVLELYWEQRPGLGIVPKSSRWIPARYYRFPYKMDAIDRMMLNPSGMLGSTSLLDFPPGQFLVSIQLSHTNYPVFAAPFRALLAWWLASKFGMEWLMQYAQIFGFPQRIGFYEPGDDQVYAQLVTLMKAAQAATWGVFPKGTEIQMNAAPGSGTILPQERLIDDADRACDIMILGQTLTTDVADSGSRALGAVHKDVFQQIVEASAKSISKIITTQIIPSIVQMNFGDLDEMPVLQPVVNTPIDLVQLATGYQILFNQMRIPVGLKQLYERIQFTQPEPSDELYTPAAPAASPGGFGGGGSPGGIPTGKGALPEEEPPEPIAAE
jgi:phage gp29-like protein